MNIAQAKQIPIEDVLRRLGHTPCRQVRDQLWYVSPFRDESKPSFKVNQSANLWYDFGESEGGDTIDLVMRLEGLKTVSEALARLSQLVGSGIPPPKASPPPRLETSTDLRITAIGPVKSRSLLAYLEQRGIHPQLATRYLHEVHYRRGENAYFALGFPSDSSGYELRNPYFKGTLGSKDITMIKGNTDRVVVFEGFFDFLTAVTLAGKKTDDTVIVLNSVVMRDKAVQAIRDLHPTTVELYRDRDQAGEQLLTFFRQSLPDTEILDMSERYAGYKDLNEWQALGRNENTSRMNLSRHGRSFSR